MCDHRTDSTEFTLVNLFRSSKIFLICYPEKQGAHIDGLLGTQIELSCSHHTPTDRFNDIAGV